MPNNKNNLDHLIENLDKFLNGLSYKDFHNGKMPRLKGDLDNGQLFVTDYHGNDLSLCKKVKPRGRAASNPYRDWKTEVKLIKTIVDNCNKKYGSPINGPFLLPEFLTKQIHSTQN